MQDRELFFNLKNKKFKLFKEQIAVGLTYFTQKFSARISRLPRSSTYYIDHFLDKIEKYGLNSMTKTANFFNLNFKFFVRPSRTEALKLVHEVNPQASKTLNFLMTNIEDFDTQTDLFKDLNHVNLGYVPNPETFEPNWVNKTIFELMALKLDKNSKDLEREWTSTTYGTNGLIKYVHEKHFMKMFGKGFTIITETNKNGHKKIKRHYASKFDDSIVVKTRTNFSDRNYIDLTDRFNLNQKEQIVFRCEKNGCKFLSVEQWRVVRHEKTCEPNQKIIYKQRDCCEAKIREFLIDEGFISDDFNPQFCAFYDCESFSLPADKAGTQKTQFLSTQRLVTIALKANFGVNGTVCFTRDSFSKDDYQKLLKQFLNHLQKLQIELLDNLPEELFASIEKIESILEQNKAAKSKGGKSLLSVRRLTKFRQGLRYLESFKLLKVFAFNGERYDLCLLIAGLIEILGPNITVVKRGAGYMMLQTKFCRVQDVSNFTVGGSMDTFAKSWGAKTEKGIYPYTLFTDITAAKQANFWPVYKDFDSFLKYKPIQNLSSKLLAAFELVKNRISLNEFSKQFCCPEILEQSLDGATFPENLELSENSQFFIDPVLYCQNWMTFLSLKDENPEFNMFLYLIYYNKIDVDILCEAFTNYCQCFYEVFKVNALDYFSLSHMSEQIMFSSFDTSANRPFSFDNGVLKKEIASQNKGGGTFVFHRMVIANPCPWEMLVFPKCVWSIKDKIVRAVRGYDANSLYGIVENNNH